MNNKNEKTQFYSESHYSLEYVSGIYGYCDDDNG